MPRMSDTATAIETLAAARAWILDIDGTLMRTARAGGEGGRVIDGAAALITWLRQQGLSILLCTQASGKTPIEYVEGLVSSGLPIDEQDVITAGLASAFILKERYPGGRILVLGTHGITVPMRDQGMNVVDPDTPPGEIDAVVLGSAASYETRGLDAACKAIEGGAGFYTTTDDFWFNGGRGRSIAPTAVIAAAIEAVVGVPATVVGKPSPLLGRMLLNTLGVEGHEVVVVDDTIPHGIRLACEMGAHSVMPLTGASRREEAAQLPDAEAPTLICESVNDLKRSLQAHAAGEDSANLLREPNNDSTTISVS